MRVKMITLLAGPNGVMFPGQEYEVDDTLGQALIGGKYAVEARPLPARPTPGGRETAMITPDKTRVLPEIPGVDGAVVQLLADKGYLEQIESVPNAALLELAGVGKATVKKIRQWQSQNA